MLFSAVAATTAIDADKPYFVINVWNPGLSLRNDWIKRECSAKKLVDRFAVGGVRADFFDGLWLFMECRHRSQGSFDRFDWIQRSTGETSTPKLSARSDGLVDQRDRLWRDETG